MIGVYGGHCVERHTATIFDRGGMKRVGPLLDISSIRWGRNRDAMSQARVVIEGDACDEQAEFIASIRSHRHELVIYRGTDRVWEGPIHRIASYPSHTEIVAYDVIDYLMHAPMTQEYDNRGVLTGPVSTRIEDIIGYELVHDRTQVPVGDTVPVTVLGWENLDPPINVLPFLDVHHWPNEAESTSHTLPYEMTVGEHLDNLAAQSGIDYTTVGRAIHIWDVSRSLGRIEQWSEANFFAEVIVTEYGSDHSQSEYVIGQDGVYGSALNIANLDYYGPWTSITTAFNEEGTDSPTEAELHSQATRNLAGRSPVPIEVRIPDNSGLVLSDTLTINSLVPGVQVPLRARLNARPLSQMQKIDHVRVNETSQGETIQITLTPTTRADSDDEEETP